jgi:hypothetical protein
MAGQAANSIRPGIVAAIAGFFVVVNTVYIDTIITDTIPARISTFFLVNLPELHNRHILSRYNYFEITYISCILYKCNIIAHCEKNGMQEYYILSIFLKATYARNILLRLFWFI